MWCFDPNFIIGATGLLDCDHRVQYNHIEKYFDRNKATYEYRSGSYSCKKWMITAPDWKHQLPSDGCWK
jgi:hypothetical protein